MNLQKLQDLCEDFICERMDGDPAHDISHVRRVVKNTLYLTDIERLKILTQASPVLE